MTEAIRPLVCTCGAPAFFGSGVNLRTGKAGTWRCRTCAEAAGVFRHVATQKRLEVPA
ncbi:hypothetical protein J2S73_001263 [Amorphus orientalis]|uniref:Uncharacterized protein n=1 Tax=Amorphus orientalis TaxID=649198 RepID=A0AAE3VNB5_9HYPH|nr:hypothetical protein [Amorphus orientalis]